MTVIPIGSGKIVTEKYRKFQMFREFRNYCLSFYGYDGIYPIAGLTVDYLEQAIVKYIDLCRDPQNFFEWGDGDSLDRERVRDLILQESV
jgi:hypothetical protein